LAHKAIAKQNAEAARSAAGKSSSDDIDDSAGGDNTVVVNHYHRTGTVIGLVVALLLAIVVIIIVALWRKNLHHTDGNVLALAPAIAHGGNSFENPMYEASLAVGTAGNIGDAGGGGVGKARTGGTARVVENTPFGVETNQIVNNGDEAEVYYEDMAGQSSNFVDAAADPSASASATMNATATSAIQNSTSRATCVIADANSTVCDSRREEICEADTHAAVLSTKIKVMFEKYKDPDDPTSIGVEGMVLGFGFGNQCLRTT
jgi:hypothetical protein